ncbi:MAG TPA: hypothetical protein VE194_00790, partial [Rubrobacter sp.]|nr:hypothetical protein [Rubrobacter sp.]
AIESLPEVVGGEPVSGVAVICQAPTLVCVDANVEPLGAALTWIDRRAGEEAREIAQSTRPARNPPTPTSGRPSSSGWRATARRR